MTGLMLTAFLVPVPLIAAGVLIVKLIAVAVTRRLMPTRRSAAWAQGAWLLVCVWVLGYSAGVWSGRFFDLSAASELCPDSKLTYPSQLQNLLPLRNSCNYADGSTTDLVPGWVNPLLFTCLAAVMVCVGMSIVGQGDRRLQQVVDKIALWKPHPRHGAGSAGDPFTADHRRHSTSLEDKQRHR